MGSGDPSGLQNRRDLALLGLVSSTLTRFRHIRIPCRCWGFHLRLPPFLKSLRAPASGSTLRMTYLANSDTKVKLRNPGVADETRIPHACLGCGDNDDK